MSDNRHEFVSLAELYFDDRVSAGRLATAIEKQGVSGWDRYGRFAAFKADSEYGITALERLARAYFNEQRSVDEGDSFDLDPASDEMFFFGWRRGELPDFSGEQVDEPSVTRRDADVIRRASTDATVLALVLRFVEGRFGFTRHPNYSTSEALIADLLGKIGPYMSERTLQTRFGEARKAIGER